MSNGNDSKNKWQNKVGAEPKKSPNEDNQRSKGRSRGEIKPASTSSPTNAPAKSDSSEQLRKLSAKRGGQKAKKWVEKVPKREEAKSPKTVSIKPQQVQKPSQKQPTKKGVENFLKKINKAKAAKPKVTRPPVRKAPIRGK